GGCAANHRAGAEEPPHQACRQRQAAHRARHAGTEGPRSAHPGRASLARHPHPGSRHLKPVMPLPSAPGLVVRGFTPPLALADFKLLTLDMDSTLINIECVDEIADAAGRKAEVAAITEAAMRGEIADYKES